MKKVLVTGATGFIGCYVIQELLSKGCQVIASSSNKDKAAVQDWFLKVAYIEFDLRLFDETVNYFHFFQQPDICIHLAWEGLPNFKEAFHIQDNLPRHKAFLKNMLLNGLQDLTVTGTCLEYGMKEGMLSEDIQADPSIAYAIAKNELRKWLEQLQAQHAFNLKWVRLFYMYGKGQSPKSLISQLEKALEANEAVFNMSGGEQVRDFLPVEKVAQYIVQIAWQQGITGIVNCCSGIPVTIRKFVQNYLKKINKDIELNLGYFEYADYEPMKFWGDIKKLKFIIQQMNNPILEFVEERKQRINSNAENLVLKKAADDFNVASNKAQYSYNFSWMGRPIIQYPQDMIAMQEIIWELKPDLIIETGIAHGGSLIYYASLLELIGKGEVLGIDIDIRKHNRAEIEMHPMFKRIKMIQGSSVDKDTVTKVAEIANGKQTVLVSLDSNHTHEHVLQELEMYAPFVTKNSYLIAFDTIVQDLPNDYMPGRPWKQGDNPKTAVWEFLKKHPEFEIDKSIDNKLLISVGPDGYLKRIK
jgi:cephalosporin hydroxylase/nucleoside-diphosphate-sugar epimerase